MAKESSCKDWRERRGSNPRSLSMEKLDNPVLPSDSRFPFGTLGRATLRQTEPLLSVIVSTAPLDNIPVQRFVSKWTQKNESGPANYVRTALICSRFLNR